MENKENGAGESTPLGDLLTSPEAQGESFDVVEAEDEKPKFKRKPKRRFDVPNFRLYAVVAAIAGITTLVIGGILFVTVSSRLDSLPPSPSPAPLSLYPYPPPGYGPGNWDVSVPLLTVNDLNSIRMNTQVWIVQPRYFDNSMSDWRYAVQDADGVQDEAWGYQLMPVPQPTPTSFPFASEIGMGARLLTTTDVGAIPAGARVRISSATQDSQGWYYIIVSEDERTIENARANQLTYAPDVTPGMTPTAALMSLGLPGQYDFITLAQVGDFPANTRVAIGSGRFDGRDWVYSVVTEDQRYVGELRQSQLAYSPQSGFGSATPVGSLPPPTPAPTATRTA